MATTNYNLPTISGASPVAIVDDYNALANATDAALAGAISGEKTRAMAAETELANGVSNALTTANSANVSATDAKSAAEKAQTTASTALNNAATAQTTADGAKSAADAAQASADAAQASADAAIAMQLTRITRANATNNGVLNFADATVIGTNETDGLEIVETADYIYIEGRGIKVGVYDYNVVIATLIPELLHAIGYVPCLLSAANYPGCDLAFERLSSGSVALVGHSTGSEHSRVAFTAFLVKPASA